MAAPNIVVFAGAPPAADVDSKSCTVEIFEEAFVQLLALPAPGTDPEALPHVAWRSLPLEPQPIPLAQPLPLGPAGDEMQTRDYFFTTADVTADESDVTWTQFCEQSLAEHHDSHLDESRLEKSYLDDDSYLDKSHIEDGSHADGSRIDDSHSHLNDDPYDDTTTSLLSTAADTTTPTIPTPAPIPISDLKQVPSPRHIAALQPQTLTLNLIVGILSISQPRTITTRWGRPLSLVEILVGDDSAAGFAVTFWLPPGPDSAAAAVHALRRQDVVLMENVALHVFGGKVYGQSLRRNLTRLALLWRLDGSGRYSTRSLDTQHAAQNPLLRKTRLVRDWILHFVGPSAAQKTSRHAWTWDKPPDDTQ